MTTRRTAYLRTALAATALAMYGTLAAAAMAPETYNGAKDQIKALYKAERARCDPMTGNAKDVCTETANGGEKVALAHLEMQRTGNASEVAKFLEARYEARYEVAKKRCDDLSGQAKDLCTTAAQTERDKAKASAKANKKVAEAVVDEADARAAADYQLERGKCDLLAGNGKDVCVAAAKARYHQ